MCWMHWKRKQRGVSLSAPIQERGNTPWQSLLNAVQDFADAAAEAPKGDAAAAWKRIQKRLRKAIERYNGRLAERRRPKAS